jgi:hypothetical protein
VTADTQPTLMHPRLRSGIFWAIVSVLGTFSALAAALVLMVAVMTAMLACGVVAGAIAITHLVRRGTPAAALGADAAPIDLRLPVLDLVPESRSTRSSLRRP